jgi:hypothetical protein
MALAFRVVFHDGTGRMELPPTCSTQLVAHFVAQAEADRVVEFAKRYVAEVPPGKEWGRIPSTLSNLFWSR